MTGTVWNIIIIYVCWVVILTMRNSKSHTCVTVTSYEHDGGSSFNRLFKLTIKKHQRSAILVLYLENPLIVHDKPYSTWLLLIIRSIMIHITHNITSANVGYKPGDEITNTPHTLPISGEIWIFFCECFGEKWPRYKEVSQHFMWVSCAHSTIFISTYDRWVIYITSLTCAWLFFLQNMILILFERWW